MARAVPLIEGAFARFLEKNRDRLNAKAGALRLAGKSLDGEAFGIYLRECVSPAVEAVEALDAARTDRVAESLFDLGAEIVAADLIARTPVIAEAWRILLPKYARLLRFDARRIAGGITNAVITLSAGRAGSADRWIARMSSIAEVVTDSAMFLEAGRVAAWVAGAAHLRAAALERLGALDPAIVHRLFKLDERTRTSPSPPELATALRADRWLDPASPAPTFSQRPRLVARLGRFRGFGGEFLVPPVVASVGPRLVARAADAVFEVHVDAFGSSLTPVLKGPAVSAGPVAPEMLEFEGVVEPASSASIDGVIAVTLRYSHQVLLYALR